MDNIVKTDYDFINKMYRYMKNDMQIELFMEKFKLSFTELTGLIELCKIYGKDINIVNKNNILVFKKNTPRMINNTKTDINSEELIHTEIGVISDTHFGNIHQQLHLVNYFYEEAYNRGINTMLHCGDLVDGNYPNRPENPRQQFLHGFDQQASYVVDMYPKVKDITTYYILGSHDETHYKNGGATINEWISRCRGDMIYLGQDSAVTNINGIKFVMDHPGGGSASSLSYKPQKRIEILESGHKPKVLLIGHYHKSYFFVYRNVRGIQVPALCDKTQFQQKQGLSNIVGGYFLDIYSDSKGNIVYFEPEEVLFEKEQLWDEIGKDNKKVKKLVIN